MNNTLHERPALLANNDDRFVKKSSLESTNTRFKCLDTFLRLMKECKKLPRILGLET